MAKIIQITTFFHPVHGGVEQQVLDLSNELIKNGHKVSVYCSDSTRLKKRIQQKKDKLGKIKIRRFKTWFSFSQFYKIYPGLFFNLLKTNFDVLHVHGFRKFEVYASLIAAKLKRKRIVVTTHNPFVTKSRSRILQFFVKLHDLTFGKIFSGFIDKVICLTPSEIPYLKKFNIKKDRIIVIPNGITKSAFIKGNKQAFIKNFKIPIDKYKYTVLFLGRLNSVKGLENLEIAVKQLSNTLFIFAGPDDNASAKYKKLYKSSVNVIFTGPIKHENTINAYATADLFLYPSKHEAFGVVLLESMAQGVPVITTNVGGPSDIVKENFGILLDPQDQWGWMININNLLKNSRIRKQKGINAKKEAKKYLWKNLIYRIFEAYKI